MGLRIQLWSYNYDPEPTGIAPISTLFARAMRVRGHAVNVVAAHPHYPDPRWGSRVRPYREQRDGIPVLRLPLWIGRRTAAQRYRQELSYAGAQLVALPWIGRPDVVVAVSPSFPALLPAIINGAARRVPLVIWLQDILPDGAVSTNLIREGPAIAAARRLERAAYRRAAAIAVVSRTFGENLEAKGVEGDKIQLILNPASRWPDSRRAARDDGEIRLLSMGNIGLSQGLGPLVRAFERTPPASHVRFVIVGTGVAESEVRAQLATGRVEVLGLIDSGTLDGELAKADLALVSQRHGGAEFNMPSKLATFMAWGLPTVAVVDPAGEVARVIKDSDAGWVVDSSSPDEFPRALDRIAARPEEVARASYAAQRYAEDNFSEHAFAVRFEEVLRRAVGRTTREHG